MEICKMIEKDIPKVKNIATVSWHATYQGIIPLDVQDNFLAMAYNEEMLLQRLTNTPFYVAKVDGEIVGYANFSNKKEAGEVELGAIYLDPSHQNKGIGSALLQYGCEQLQPKKVFINVESENNIGKQFYIAKGFESIGEFNDDFDGHKLKTVRMVLSLDGEFLR